MKRARAGTRGKSVDFVREAFTDISRFKQLHKIMFVTFGETVMRKARRSKTKTFKRAKKVASKEIFLDRKGLGLLGASTFSRRGRRQSVLDAIC